MGVINSQQVIIGFLIVCGFMLLWSLWKRQLITMVIKGMVGMGIIWTINLLLPAIAIGLNWITVGISCILGIPGIMMMYVFKVFIFSHLLN